jgi:hypothetical protein
MVYGQYGRPKQCQNNCGIEIAWDTQAGYFINTSNSQRHDCPNWEKRKTSYQYQPQQSQPPQQQQSQPEQNSGFEQEVIAELKGIRGDIQMVQWMQEKLLKHMKIDDVINNDNSK